jgi:NADPH:quinone reductase-like Zn-dependent oxidoreductase
MKLYEFRETKGIDSLMLTEREAPMAGSGQVLIRVHAVSLNYRDLLIAQGRYPAPASRV